MTGVSHRKSETVHCLHRRRGSCGVHVFNKTKTLVLPNSIFGICDEFAGADGAERLEHGLYLRLRQLAIHVPDVNARHLRRWQRRKCGSGGDGLQFESVGCISR